MDKEELYRINTMYNADYFNTILDIASSGTFKQAWEQIEETREEIGLPGRYTSYASFRKAFHLYSQKRINKTKIL